MDRGIPTEAVLSEMRDSDPPVYLLTNPRSPGNYQPGFENNNGHL